jgi:two-component system, NtrC family, sensor kinase
MNDGIISTIYDRCKRCYSCVRECPAKAIQVLNGQAAVVPERCIACGHCVKVCSQKAKNIKNDAHQTLDYILAFDKTAAIVAPSFAASFPDGAYKFPTALRHLGFNYVIETAFGADLISPFYKNEMQKGGSGTIINSSCPAVVNYIEKYYGDLVPNLARVVSPMIATARYIKEKIGEDTKIIFIGPCIAKMSEYKDPEVAGVIDAVLTFSDIKEVLQNSGININNMRESDFDPPIGYLGKAYPLAGGLLKTADISGDVLEKEIIVVEGKKKVIDIIEDISRNNINAKLVDLLFCEGCISGPAIDSDLNYYSKREKIIDYVNHKINAADKQVWKSNIYNSRNLDLSRGFTHKNQRRPMPNEERIKEILAETKKYTEKDELNCGSCGYISCREYAIAIGKGLAEKEMCLPFLIDELGKAYNDLKDTQEQLRIAEKLASIGQLAAGVAHEINNPLATILLYSSMLKEDLEKNCAGKTTSEDLQLVIEEANRCKNIVNNLLNFARQGKLHISRINMCNLFNSILKGVRLNPANRDIIVQGDRKLEDCLFDGDEEQLKQVFLNLINNACEAMEESKEKKISIKLFEEGNYLLIEISDTGAGISRENYSKIFTPFFTTKKIGKGTGLGLAITYGIVKMHRGFISFQSEVGKGTTFKVKLPKNLASLNINSN